MGNLVDIYEVGPRDGFQNLKDYIPLKDKFFYIQGMIEAGLSHIQITSFVSPSAIPQMKDAQELTGLCLERFPTADLFSLVPNLYGARKAWECGLKKTSYVISLSESHNKANLNRTRDESFSELEKIRKEYPDLKVILDVATTFACPFEGKMDLDELMRFLDRAYVLGIREFALCDTIGVANPAQVRSFVSKVKSVFKDCKLQVHIHDTRGMGIVNTLVAIESGITSVQSTLGGLGGCPFAPGASGNTSTEDLVYMLNQMGYVTGVDFDKLLQLAKREMASVEGAYSGHHIHIGESCSTL